VASRPVAKSATKVRHPCFKLADGILVNRPGHRHQQSDGDSQRHFDESVRSDNPRWATGRDKNNDAECDGGEAVGGAETQDRTEDSAEKYAGTVDDPILTGIAGDECAENRADSGPREALPGESEWIDSREQNHDGGDRRPIEVGQLEAARQKKGYDRGNCGTSGGDENIASEPQAGRPRAHNVVIVSYEKQSLRDRTLGRGARDCDQLPGLRTAAPSNLPGPGS
jgi:hypothetical protein